MENEPVAVPEETREEPLTAAAIEKQFSALTQKILEQIEQNAQAAAARHQEMDDREKELTQRELLSRAREALSARELPAQLADCLAFKDEAAVDDAVDALEQAFRAAVQQGVEERLSNSAPKTGATVPLDQLSDEEYYAAVCRND